MHPSSKQDPVQIQITSAHEDQSLCSSVINKHKQYLSLPEDIRSSHHKTAHQYRPDIDGLRTVAVAMVIVYHAYPELISGGFIGVDVFFVISGYLISQILVNELESSKFSIKQFYIRRTKRILPALLTILLFTLLITWRLASNQQSTLTLKTLNASLFSAANLQILSHQQGYWDIDVRKNPLLHLWSLGVEEQFYIVWPVLLWVVFRFWRTKMTMVLVVYALGSFGWGVYEVERDAKFAFYFPLCRFWEMAVGGIVAYNNNKGMKIQNSLFSNLLSLSSLAIIIITAFTISQQNLFPGYWALIPTLGASVLILTPQSLINAYFLSSKSFVFLGKISYSLYLWHWPLLVYSRTFYPQGSTSILARTWFILMLTVILSVGSYFLVENPVRRQKNNRITVTVIVLVMVVVGVLSFNMPLKKEQIIPIGETNSVEQTPSAQSDNLPPQVKYFTRIDQQMKPRQQQDFILKNGRHHPNLSKSQNRTKPTLQTIKAPMLDLEYDLGHGGETILEKDVDKGSVFYQEKMPYFRHYHVANEGRENILLMVGDSHMTRLTYRFQQLFRDSKKAGTLDQFPTLVDLSTAGMQLDYRLQDSRDRLQFVVDWVKKYKPKRVFLACHWILYWCEWSRAKPVTAKGECNIPVAKKSIEEMMQFVKEIQKHGAEVSAITIDLDGPELDPQKMITLSEVIQKNIQPFKLSDFRRKHQSVIDLYETALKQNNVSIIDLSDNLCYEDICHVVAPSGYAPYTDSGHYGKFYAHHWMSAVDHLVQF